MELVFSASGCQVPDHWYEPLSMVLEEVRDDPSYAFLHRRDFTARALVLRRNDVDIVQYAHAPTGRYLYADYHGNVFRFAPPKDPRRGAGRIVATSAYEALDALLLPAATRFDPPLACRPDGRPSLRLIHGGLDA